ncbi:zinc ABC transporter permease AztB [Homoserinibacter sp. YIM 151385]|uniref:zinc ABC transporter permease AztB n=1 Tax=Homoserinibacter sp. YIM 151385 TaxID=2985506 RepID=UPI0022F0570F|nr:zinc ABC transporter permease AztB [Homoserinibacter sp. YIM 151385]WBU38071.1 zinc ABC transporter permease AztB [Homoserinibacter sp. YIM 151385]
MDHLLEPLQTAFLQRALLGGILTAALCGVVGTWVVIRGMAFLGEALAHGMLPGIAIALLLGAPPVLGAALSASAMSLAVGALTRRRRLAADTSIGLVFAGMLAAGVAIASASRSFAGDITAILFGDILAIRGEELALLAGGLALAILVAALGRRPFALLALDERIAHTMGMRPRVAEIALTGLVTLAVVVAYQAVGALLVVALLLAPAVAAGAWTRRVPTTMLLAAALGSLAVLLGLLASWHLGTAGGASIALAAVLVAGASHGVRAALARLRGRSAGPPAEPEDDPGHDDRIHHPDHDDHPIPTTERTA